MTEMKPRRLAVVECRTVRGEPDSIHLSVEEWSPRFGEWFTGMALCGQSADQGALDPATSITCQGCESHRDGYERALSGRPTAEQEELTALRAHLDLATEFRIPCPEAADPGRPEGGPILQPEPLLVQKTTTNWADRFPDGWRIFNPNLDNGDHVWTGDGWVYCGKLHMGVIYQWTRDQAIAEAQRLAVEETRRYEAWLATMKAGAQDR